ncbi:riboflavin biosynthesis protein RibD C-terminal domain protein [Streptococcus ictaluri 707-05]|uniref:Riboflavin biosynthesis protein RibD C-terminal domain protein n=1 Tax=Streptococcus ictaluri 707-05 TaxID=764299 RepID=G5K3C6_9STRE|nr:riboflavin biosynthesis protein RibD C-terminal domain protein [Streptococcus ictaluri 707-05]
MIFTNDPISLLESLKEENRGNIWLFGGGELVRTLLAQQLIDHFIIGFIPTILGGGKGFIHHK